MSALSIITAAAPKIAAAFYPLYQKRLREFPTSLHDEILRLGKANAPQGEELALAHDQDYIRRASEGRLTEIELRRIGFPWSAQMIERSRRSSGATIEAGRAALD